MRTPAATKPSIFSWQPTSLPMDTTTTWDKVEKMRTTGNLRPTTAATSSTTKMTFSSVSTFSTPRPVELNLNLNEVDDQDVEDMNRSDEGKREQLQIKSSEKVSKMKKDFISDMNLSKPENILTLPGKKLNRNKKRILLDPSYLTGCTEKGNFKVPRQ